ncbi:hypothetical protein CBM2589_A10236 [Cupriavidus taiwanensis]|uniref:Uncharacterized protein n=1 Tax=Cupriavidus taiwanensis TaxID=164546 RepID=A0A975X584_9BURK|nr:hypothetical protein CBM2589_A10236 [Cupriavidus taiwanensis]
MGIGTSTRCRWLRPNAESCQRCMEEVMEALQWVDDGGPTILIPLQIHWAIEVIPM